MQSYFTYNIKDKKRGISECSLYSPCIGHYSPCKGHCEIAHKRLVFSWPQFKSLFIYKLHLLIRICVEKLQDLNKSISDIKASRHLCSLHAYITSIQHNIISNFIFIKYNLPMKWLFFISLETRYNYAWYHSFLRWFLNKSMHDTLVFFFSICVHTVIALLNNCPMHGEFPSDAWLKMNAREKHFQM